VLRNPTVLRLPRLGPFLPCLALATCLVLGTWSPLGAEEKEPGAVVSTVYLVRHAEKGENDTADPPLSEAGKVRARSLVPVLRDIGVTHLHSTDFQRTRQTLAPLAEATGLTVEIYDPRDLAAFAERLRKTPGVHVVAGHSNTTPELVRLLGGDPRSDIDESEFDRLYIVMPETGWSALLHLPPWDER